MRSGDHFMTHNGIEYASVKGAAQSAGVVEQRFATGLRADG